MEIDFPKEIHLEIPKPLGDTVISTAVVSYLLNNHYCISNVTIWTEKPAFFKAFEEEDRFKCVSDYKTIPKSAIKLESYLDLLPHIRKPRQHHIISMLEILYTTLGINADLPKVLPLPVYVPSEKASVETRLRFEELREWKTDRALVWICPRSTSCNRNPSDSFWSEFAERVKDKVALIEFLGPGEKAVRSNNIRAESIPIGQMAAMMKACDAGIAVDTFGLHLAASVGFTNVIAVLSSSHPDCVCYPGNLHVFNVTDKTAMCQPCGNHGYVESSLIIKKLEIDKIMCFNDETKCIHSEILCINNISVKELEKKLLFLIMP